MSRLPAAFAIFALLVTNSARAESVVEVSSVRGGPSIRVLVEKPVGTPLGAVVLLAGGHGNLNIAKDGTLGWGKGNQLVRTRGDYARAGFIAVVPDIAADMKEGNSGKARYRWSTDHARDVGAIIKYARSLGGSTHLVGTSRAALTVAKVAATLKAGDPGRPDSLVITAGMTVTVDPSQPSAEKNVPGLGGITQPILLYHHANDACRYTPSSAPTRFKQLLTSAKRVDVKLVSGGDVGSGDPCQAQSAHGFLGLDQTVVTDVTAWIKAHGK